MARRPLSDFCIILYFLREGLGWSQTALGEAAGVSASLINDYEAGRKRLTRARLEYLISFMGLTPEAVDHALARLAANRALSRLPHGASRATLERRDRIEALATKAGTLAADYTRSLLSEVAIEAERLRERHRAEELWARLRRRTPEERQALLEESLRFRTWALAERVCAESIEMASQDAEAALGLAMLAVKIAEFIPGEALWRSRVMGYALAHLANVERVCGDLRKADKTLSEAKRLWESGTPADPGLLTGVWIIWIEATLRHIQQRFGEAGRRIEEALALDRGELRPRLLYTKARILEATGSPEESTKLLREAASLVDLAQEPRFALGLKIQLLVNLCDQGFAAEADLELEEVRQLSQRVGRKADSMRVLWIEGRVAAALGRSADAGERLREVRAYFEAQGVGYDYAIVSLELSVVLLQESQTAEVRDLALELVQAFEALALPENALAALRIFCEAAVRERITIELARRVLAFLHLAQRDPRSRFAPQMEAGTEENQIPAP